ncbi:sodium:proton antiporter [Lichenicola cladoniae]|uniref:Sodium:proton antiporter n=1 Tax=Lichenicola cladoniae TaxID=1484109 RepID=A0A6M8HLM5_9PROT|nr:cation:proton antiporter [Lichenicola cladoniae]NPD70216.1 sodium:proton antiporter [Acetobacteraceae bacterium]QKE89254.1 sodium:proton antiporter [Lichenicola cladoniae]
MTIPDPWLLAFSVTALLLLLGASSGLVNSELWMSEPLVCALAGILLGPVVFGFIRIDPGHDPTARAVFREARRVTLAIAVLASAVRLPRGWLRRHWRSLSVALGPGMLLMWAAGTAVAWVCLGLPLLDCALVGAILAPTDPVLSAPVVSGPLARRTVPDDLRHAINAESGINDGLAQPFVMIPLFLILATRPGLHGHGIGDWLLQVLAIEIGSAVVLGAAAGWAAGVCLRWAGRHPDAERSSLLTIALALALATLAGLQAIGGNGVLGAFVAGAVLNESFSEQHEEHQEHFNEAVARFFDLPIMFLLGAAAPWADWYQMGWRAPVFVLCILLFRRLPAWLLLGGLMSWTRPFSHRLFAGWFGPVGAAALFYACDAQGATGIGALWPVVSLAAAASVVAHGITGTHLSVFLGRSRQRGNAA